jgi:hypothetical protein
MPPRTFFTCTVPDCGRPHRARGFCNRCYQRWKIHGSPTINLRPHRGTRTTCRLAVCDGAVYGLGLCESHYRRLYRTGKLVNLWGELEIERMEVRR